MGGALTQKLLELFKDVPRPVALHEPCLTGNEALYVKDCIDTGWVSSAGSYVDQFEQKLSDYVGAYAVVTVNGTAALHLSLLLAGIEPGDEVLTPTLTFVATANAVSYCKAIPHFVEAEVDTFGVCPDRLRQHLEAISEKKSGTLINKKTGRPIKALIVAHIFGLPARLEELQNICTEFGLILIEDAAESLGSFYKGQHTGSFGLMGTLSFNGNKIITTGGGGAVLTRDKKLAEQVKHLSTTARVPDPFSHRHDRVGYNYRLPNINAAMGCAQMEKIDLYLAQKKALAEIYKNLLSGFSDVVLVQEPSHTKINNWLNTIKLPDTQIRNALLTALNEQGILCRGIWQPMHELPMYTDCPQMDCSEASRLASCSLNLPSSPQLLEKLQK
jgi:perosamine synthetase